MSRKGVILRVLNLVNSLKPMILKKLIEKDERNICHE